MAALACAAPARADDGSALPRGRLELTPVVNLQSVGFVEGNDGWGAKPPAYGPVGDAWLELSVEPGLEGQVRTAHDMTFFGEVTGLFSFTGGGLDAGDSNFDPRRPKDFLLEKAYLGWRSGDLFPDLGKDALEISGGSQRYTIGTGMLIRTGGSSGGKRGAYWLSPRTAFQITGIARLHTGPLLAEAFYLRPNDEPFTKTDIAGANLEYTFSAATLGLSYLQFLNSLNDRRDGLAVYDARAGVTPLPPVADFRIDGEVALEENGSQIRDSYGWWVEPGYQFSSLPWKPRLSYRYAFFRGDDPGSKGNRNFDPLFYSTTDWGAWIQGELLGEFASINSNLVSHQVRVRATPSDSVVLNVIYYHFRSDTLSPSALTLLPASVRQSGRMTSRDLCDEVDFTLDWTVTGQLSLSAVYGFNVPDQGVRSVSGGNQVWSQAMLYLGWSL